jgi:hypothetical protein
MQVRRHDFEVSAWRVLGLSGRSVPQADPGLTEVTAEIRFN